MYALIQRVLNSKVVIQDKNIAQIGQGILAFIGIAKEDTEKQATRIVERILGYRVFEDSNNNMNHNLVDIKGGLLLVPQFTLAADTKKGMRPSFSNAKPPSEAKVLFNYLIEYAKKKYSYIACGEFGADMKVHLINDGPVTFLLNS